MARWLVVEGESGPSGGALTSNLADALETGALALPVFDAPVGSASHSSPENRLMKREK